MSTYVKGASGRMGITFGAGVVLCARTCPNYPSPTMIITIAVTGKAITRSARKCCFSAFIRLVLLQLIDRTVHRGVGDERNIWVAVIRFLKSCQAFRCH